MLTVERGAGYQLNRIQVFVLTKGEGGTLKENLIDKTKTIGYKGGSLI